MNTLLIWKSSEGTEPFQQQGCSVCASRGCNMCAGTSCAVCASRGCNVRANTSCAHVQRGSLLPWPACALCSSFSGNGGFYAEQQLKQASKCYN